jgi:DNA polymerase III epsilon subunit-like protein
MRFLQLKEACTGVVFDQPVLDTLLLSALVHPQQESHRLESIAERLGVPVLGRHTALGDAMVTAEVFSSCVPLLAELGIRTLGQARDAAQKTYYGASRTEQTDPQEPERCCRSAEEMVMPARGAGSSAPFPWAFLGSSAATRAPSAP